MKRLSSSLDSRDSDSAAQPIDRYVRLQLKETGLASAPRAAPYREVRRLSLMLTGLPPDPAVVVRFVDHPTVPLNQIVAQLNIDMIGRSRKAGDTDSRNANLTGPDEIYVIGSKMMSSDLGALSEKVNQSYLKLQFNYKYDDPNDTERFFFRSDHYNYAKRGIPIIFYFDGVHADYHRQSDHPDKIDYDKMEKVTRTVFASLWKLASGPRPKVDRQLPAQLAGN